MKRDHIARSGVGSNNPEASYCTGKVAFASPRLASKVAGRHRANGTKRHAYHCPSCGKWHLSNVRAKARPKAPPRVEDRDE